MPTNTLAQGRPPTWDETEEVPKPKVPTWENTQPVGQAAPGVPTWEDTQELEEPKSQVPFEDMTPEDQANFSQLWKAWASNQPKASQEQLALDTIQRAYKEGIKPSELGPDQRKKPAALGMPKEYPSRSMMENAERFIRITLLDPLLPPLPEDLEKDVQALANIDPKAAEKLYDENGELTIEGQHVWDSVLRGIDIMQQTGYGLGKMGADLLGVAKLSDWFGNKIMEQQAEIAANPRVVPTFADIGKGFESGLPGALPTTRRFRRWAVESIGEQVPNLVTTFGAGYLSRFIAKKVVNRTLEKTLVDAAIERTMAERALAAAAAKVEGATATGIWAASAGIETGAIYSDMASQGIEGPVPAMIAMLAGISAGFLEAVGPYLAIRRIGKEPLKGPIEAFVRSTMGEAFVENGILNLGVAAFEQAMVEGGTEYLQTAIEEAARISQDPKAQGAFWKTFFEGLRTGQEYREATAQGALIGGVFGFGGQLIGTRYRALQTAAERRAFELGVRHEMKKVNQPWVNPAKVWRTEGGEKVTIRDREGNPVTIDLPTKAMPEVVTKPKIPVLPNYTGDQIVDQALSMQPEVAPTQTGEVGQPVTETDPTLAKLLGIPYQEPEVTLEVPERGLPPLDVTGTQAAARQVVAEQAEAQEAQGEQVTPRTTIAAAPSPEYLVPTPEKTPPVTPQAAPKTDVEAAKRDLQNRQKVGLLSHLEQFYPHLRRLFDVVLNGNELPESVKAVLKEKGLNFDALDAVFVNGRVIFNAAKFPLGDVGLVHQKVAHETFAHLGLRQALGERFGDVMREIYDNLSPLDRAKIAARNRIAPGQLEQIGEEWLAYEFERVINEGKTNSLWAKIASAVRRVLRKLGFPRRYSDVEIANLLAKGRMGAELAVMPTDTAAEAGPIIRLSTTQDSQIDEGSGGQVVQEAAVTMDDADFVNRVAQIMERQTGKATPEAKNVQEWTQEEIDGEAVRFSLAPPVMNEPWNELWLQSLDHQARTVHDYYKQFHDAELAVSKKPQEVQKYVKEKKGKKKATTGRRWETVKSGPVLNRSLTTAEMNDWLSRNPHAQEAFAWAATRIQPDVKRQMGLNDDGTFELGMWDKEGLHVYRSFMQRLMDARNNVVQNLNQSPVYYLSDTGGVINIAPAGLKGPIPLQGDEPYRRAILQEYRRQFAAGTIGKVPGPGNMSFDRWGTMGFTAKNDKTMGSGDFTTLCPQMYIDGGCDYCYRRSALESNINNKLGAEKVWYTGEFLRLDQKTIDAMNAVGGFRIQSFGDFFKEDAQTRAMIADMLYDAEMIGLQVKIITKSEAMIEFLAQIRDQFIPVRRSDGQEGFVGEHMFVNLSADYMMERAEKNVPWNRPRVMVGPGESAAPGQTATPGVYFKRAYSVEEADAVAKKYPWVNIRTVALTVDEFLRSLQDPRVHVVTGYHGDIRELERISILEDGGRRVEVEVEPIGDNGMPKFNPVTGELVDAGKTHFHKKLAYGIARLGLQKLYYRKSCCITGKCASCSTRCGATNADKYTGGTSFSSQEVLRENIKTTAEVIREYNALGVWHRVMGYTEKQATEAIVAAIEDMAAVEPVPPPADMPNAEPYNPETSANTSGVRTLVPPRSTDRMFIDSDKSFVMRTSVSQSSVTQADVNRLLEEYGWQAIDKQMPQKAQEILDRVQRRIAKEPWWIDGIIKRQEEDPRTVLNTDETMALNWWLLVTRTEFENASAKRARLEKKGRLEDSLVAQSEADFWQEPIQRLAKILHRAGSEAGRAFWARKVILDLDFSYQSLVNQKRQANGWRKLYPEELDRLSFIAEAYKMRVKQLEQEIAKMRDEDIGDEMKAIMEDLQSINPAVVEYAKEWVANQEKRGRDAEDRFKVKWARFFPDSPLNASITEGNPRLPDELMAELAIAGSALMSKNIVEKDLWKRTMMGRLGVGIEPYLEEVWEMALADMNNEIEKGRQEWVRRRPRKKKPAPAPAPPPGAPAPPPGAPAVPIGPVEVDLDEEFAQIRAKISQILQKRLQGEGDVPAFEKELYWPTQRLIRIIVQMNPLISRQQLVDAVHAIFRADAPNVTEEETRDTISGRGREITPSQEAIDKTLRDLKAQVRIETNKQAIENGRRTKRTGLKRDTPSDEQRRLISEYNEAKRRFPQDSDRDTGSQTRSYLDSRKTWYRNRMSDMEYEIKEKTLISNKTRSTQTDPELEALKEKYAEVKARHDAIFNPKVEMTDEQRLEIAERMAEREIAILEADLEKGIITASKEPHPLTSQKLEAMRLRIAQLRAEQEWAQRQITPPSDLNTIADIREWFRLDAEINKVQNQLAEQKPFSPKRKVKESEAASNRALVRKLADLKAQRAEMQKKMGPPRATPSELASKHKVAVMRRQIADIQERMAMREFGPKKRGEAVDISTDPTAAIVQVQLDNLKRVYERLKEEFGPPAAKLTQAERTARAEKAAERVLAKLQKDLAKGVAAAGPEPGPIASARLDNLRTQIRQLRAEIEWQQRGLPKPEEQMTTEQIDRWFQLDRQIQELQRQIDTGDITPRRRPPTPTEAAANQKLADQLAGLKRQRQAMRDALKPPKPSETEQRILRKMAVMRNQIANFEKRMAEKDFSPRVRREPVDFSKNAKAVKLAADRDRIAADFQLELEKDRWANLTKLQKMWEGIKKTPRLSLNLVSSVDFSGMRQGLLAFFSLLSKVPLHPTIAVPKVLKVLFYQFGAFFSRKLANKMMKKMQMRYNWTSGADKVAGIEYSDVDDLNPTTGEENLRSLFDEWGRASFIERDPKTGKVRPVKSTVMGIPRLGFKTVAGSNRAFGVFLNLARSSLMDALTEINFKHRPPTDTELMILGNWVNIATGRGKLNPAASRGLAFFLWAPKLALSRIQFMMGQPLWMGPRKGSAYARYIIAKEYVGVLITGFILGLVAFAFSDKKELDPRSSDAGKMVRGNTRVDLWGGLQQFVVALWRVATGESKSVRTGQVIDLVGKGTRAPNYNMFVVLMNFLRSKLRPDWGTFVDILTRRDFRGRKTTPATVAQNLTAPLSTRDLMALMKDRGVPEGIALEAINALGFGTSVYNPEEDYGLEAREWRTR